MIQQYLEKWKVDRVRYSVPPVYFTATPSWWVVYTYSCFSVNIASINMYEYEVPILYVKQ